MEYKHKLQRAREKLRLGRAEPQRAWEKPQYVREEPARSPLNGAK